MYSVSLKTVFFMGSSYQNGLFLINVSKWPQCFKMEDLSDFLGQFDLKLYLKAKNHIFHKYICECPQIPNFVFRLIWQITDYKLSKIVPILIHLCLNGFYVSKLSFLSDVYLFFCSNYQNSSLF